MGVWQIGCGESGRRYHDLFLRHDVMFCGPGDDGAYDPAVYRQAVKDGRVRKSQASRVRAFARQVRPGDVVLLRSGHRVITLGVVADPGYAFEPAFDDVYGWNLSHAHRVVWQEQFVEELAEIQRDTKGIFGIRKQVPTFTAVSDDAILAPIQHLIPRCAVRLLKELPPKPPAPLSPDEFGEALFARGMASDAVLRVKAAVEKQRRLLHWYRSSAAPGRPTEHEVVAHVILPLMLALGWSEQLLAVEWQKIDLAVFWGTPTDGPHCELICEAKGFGHGLQNVLRQAIDYTDKLGLSNCRKILLADGGRFYLYRRGETGWGEQPWGYMNVAKLRVDHLCPKGTSAVDTLMALTPAHLGR
jgi:hypothetical protein